MALVPAQYDITIYQGSEWAETWTQSGIASAVGYSAEMEIRASQSKTSTLIARLTSADGDIGITSDGSKLILAVRMGAAESDLLDFDLAYYDIEITPPTGVDYNYMLLYGKVQLHNSVTN